MCMERIINFNNYYDEYGVYDVNDVLNKFNLFFDMSFSSLLLFFLEFDRYIISRDDVLFYCEDELGLDICDVNKRVNDYNVFYKKIYIYREKGLKILDLFIYLCGNKNVKYKEKILDDLCISHCESIICGRDVIRLLTALINIKKCYEENIDIINDLHTFDNINFDNFALSSKSIYPDNSIYPSLENSDKTSLSLVKKRFYKYL